MNIWSRSVHTKITFSKMILNYTYKEQLSRRIEVQVVYLHIYPPPQKKPPRITKFNTDFVFGEGSQNLTDEIIRTV